MVWGLRLPHSVVAQRARGPRQVGKVRRRDPPAGDVLALARHRCHALRQALRERGCALRVRLQGRLAPLELGIEVPAAHRALDRVRLPLRARADSLHLVWYVG
ncbi:hypothetical protein T484DRAFT_2721124 [Baffinella frigidus]|nr:hypothetical protein T484DRAFT_2721124 [Cryptophyta sp. CCMP2293]